MCIFFYYFLFLFFSFFTASINSVGDIYYGVHYYVQYVAMCLVRPIRTVGRRCYHLYGKWQTTPPSLSK